MQELLKKLQSKQATIGIIGLGYVGLPLILGFTEGGVKTIGFDIDAVKVGKLNNGKSYFHHIQSERISNANKNGMSATTDFSEIANVDAIILCVPTPLNQYKEPDLSYIRNTMQMIALYLRAEQLLSLESTTYPGTTEEELLPYLENAGLKAGEDFAIVYSPEREDPGNKDFTVRSIPKIVSGYSATCLQCAQALYEIVVDTVVPVSDLRVAEMAKLLENIHRSVNIGLVNEMKIIADRMDINIYEVIEAAASKPFGFVPYYPGPGIGGHCIPIDPFYLTWKAKEYGVHTRFIELAGEINSHMPKWVIEKLMVGLNEQGKALKGSKILLLGLAYKKNVDDMRESPCLELLKHMLDMGADVDYSDSYIPHIPKLRKYDFNKSSTDISADTLKNYDAVVIGTDHDDFDYDLIAKYAHLVLDTRGVYKDITQDNIIRG